ncbi:MAG: DUF2071 domain-containing protein [Edaphobacter sp.]
MASTFLTAEWRKLIMANYIVAEDVLRPYLPVGTKLDRYNGHCYVSLVGFLFQDTRLKSISIPFHRTFEEVNLRFYVQQTQSTGERRRGVVFISELVPRFALSLVANAIYGENYVTVALRHRWEQDEEQRSVSYQWRHKNRWNELSVRAALHPQPIEADSAEEFFTEHYWGYTKRGVRTSQYEVLHPRWMMYPIVQHSIDVDFGALYGSGFSALTESRPESVLLAEGSKIEVRAGEPLAAAS